MIAMSIVQDALEEYEIICELTPEDGALKGIRFSEKILDNTLSDKYLYLVKKDSDIILSSNYGKITVKNADIDIIYKTICERIEMLEAWKEDLNKMIFYNCTLQEISTRSQGVLKNAFFITDESNHVLALSSHAMGTVTKEWDYIVQNRRMIVEVVQDIFNGEPFKKHFYSKFEKAFYYRPKGLEYGSVSYRIPSPESNGFMGTLVILETQEPFLKAIYHYATILGNVISSWVKLHYKESPMASASIAFGNLVDGELPTESQKVLLSSIIESENKSYKVLAIRPIESIGIESYIYMFEENFYDCVFCDYKSTILILTGEVNSESLINSIRLLLREKIESIGVSCKFYDFEMIKGFAKQALFAQTYSKNEVMYYDSECTMKNIVKEVKEQMMIESLINTALLELKEHDHKHNTEYSHTLYTFLKNERSIADCLPILNIHRNSMIYRLKRIDELLDANLDDYYTREHLLFSFELMGF